MLVAWSPCRRWRVEVHADQTAALWDHGTLVASGPLHVVAVQLAALGLAGDDLTPD